MSTGWGSSSGFGGTSAFNGGAQLTPGGNFGSSATNTTFGQKPALVTGASQNTSGGLFGNSAGGLLGQNSQSQNLGGLFGNTGANSASNTSGGLFGTSNNTVGNTASTGLFGNSANNMSTTSNSGGFLGNSSTSGNTNANGLFGNSSTNTSNASSGGLFGNSSTNNTGGLFGNSGTTNTSTNASGTSTGGLFGNKPATGGLFGSSSTSAAPSSGLFGNSSNNAAASGLLFGKPATAATAASGGLFGNSSITNNTQSGGLFGNSSVLNKPTSGLLGGTGTGISGGLFGNSSNNAISKPAGGLFAQQNALNPAPGIATTTSSSNPYNSGSILSTIKKTEMVMPQSITGNLFAKSGASKSKDVFSQGNSKAKESKSSLFSKLAQTFKIFRTTSDTASIDLSISRLKGIFSQLNYVKDDPMIDKSKYSVTKPRSKSHSFILPLENHVADVKRLVIKSKPLKFHLIDADKVFNAKRRRVLTLALTSTHHYNSLTDDEESDIEQFELAERQERQVAQEVPIKKSPADNVEQANLDAQENNDGYWCSPTLKDLSELSESELSHVENFIVGRFEVGQIAYNYPVDLSALFSRCKDEGVLVASELFGKMVKMEGSIVRVYDDEEIELKKPPIGFELNVPATITIKAPPKKYISKREHIRRLQNLTGMEFITFDPLTDNWTFKVKHFSVWGLIDDSEEEDEDPDMKRLRDLKKEQDKQEGEASAIYSRIYENDEYNQELKRQKIGGLSKGVPGSWNYDSTAQSGGALGFKQKMVQDEINRLVNLYKQDKSVDALAANASDITIESDSEDVKSPNSLALEGPLYPEEIKNFDYLKQIVSVLPPNTDINDLVDEKAYEPDIEDEAVFDNFNRLPSLATSKYWLLQLELANDIDSALTPYLTIPRNHKLSLKAVNEILFSDFDRSSVDLNQISTPIKEVKKQPVSTKSDTENIDVSSVSKLVQNLLLKANMQVRKNKFPRLQLDGTLNFKEIDSISKPDSDSGILELASILFDKVELSTYNKYNQVDFSDSTLVRRLEILEQRKSFASWLRKNNQESLPSNEDPLSLIKNQVIQGKLKFAIETAMGSHNSHLAALLTLVDSNDSVVRSIAQNQLEDWESNKTTDLIPTALVTIYKILAGQFSEVSKELSFRQSVGLYIYYSNPADSLENVLKNVQDDGSSDDLADIIRIYTALKFEGYATCVNSIKRSGLSERTKWLLLCILTRNNGEGNLSATGDEISESFGTFLSSRGMWKESIFVFASISDDNKVKSLIRDTVIKEISQIKCDNTDEEEYLVKVLGVPRGLVYEAVAIEKATKKDHWGEGHALVQAKLWNEAHDTIRTHLGPAAVIDNDFDLKSQLRALIVSFPDQGSIIPKWNQGAGLYATYFNVIEAFNQQEAVSGDDLTFLLNNLALISDYDSFTVKVAITIMSKRIGDIALEYKQGISELRKKIMALNLGENELSYFDNRLIGVGL